MELEPIDPDTAIELYIAEKETEFSAATLRSRESRLGHFRRWCACRDITNLNELSGRKLQEYKLWRRNEGDLSKVTVKTQVDTLRVSIRWLDHRRRLAGTAAGDARSDPRRGSRGRRASTETHRDTMNTRDRYLRAVYLIQVATNEPAGTSAIAERLDMIIDRRPECPDCFDAEADQCALPGAEADD